MCNVKGTYVLWRTVDDNMLFYSMLLSGLNTTLSMWKISKKKAKKKIKKYCVLTVFNLASVHPENYIKKCFNYYIRKNVIVTFLKRKKREVTLENTSQWIFSSTVLISSWGSQPTEPKLSDPQRRSFTEIPRDTFWSFFTLGGGACHCN